MAEGDGKDDHPFAQAQRLWRTLDFFGRVAHIYGSYKTAQIRALFLRAQGCTTEEIHERVWVGQHTYAGDRMYDLCVSLRGFYLKAGQFIGARNDFVPAETCRILCLLHDRVPPMSPEMTKKVLEDELGVKSLDEVFQWIDLETPLGSASISQVHKAQLRRFSRATLRQVRHCVTHDLSGVTVQAGQTPWDVCNQHGVSMRELARLNTGVDLDQLREGQVLRVPTFMGLQHFSAERLGGESGEIRGSGAALAVAHAQAARAVTEGALVAVKVQYPEAQEVMVGDLSNLRVVAAYLSKTELKFDLVSAVDELQRQIRFEFDFMREARVMESIANDLHSIRRRVLVPRPVPGLVTRRVLAMTFIEGEPLQSLADRLASLSPRRQAAAKRLLLSRVSEAYGRMMLGSGMFQADGHPGNLLVLKGGRVGLLDYGQSKQLSDPLRLALARLVLALHGGCRQVISDRLAELGVSTSTDDLSTRSDMAYGMFDTRGSVDPFDQDTPLKKSSISAFPRDAFFVLRVVQLLRGMSSAMGILDFSCADQWAHLARRAERQLRAKGVTPGLPVEPLDV